ncbi:hypothetical protein HNY73_007836 [Argiope bruennichi]|uniref:Uncharacterized protein n=1 Tax=Argiope bruennichi TaxID=94029 RepID=A0A8T0F5E8_ARGBR|nr:hypothetical protein HNY73_007836 [Argiope bruennichi]
MTLDSEQAETEAKVKAEQAKLETKLRNERTNTRRLFTTWANTFDEIHRMVANEKDSQIQCSKVIEKAERLLKVGEEFKELIDYTDEDYVVTESYRDIFKEIREVYEKHYSQHSAAAKQAINDSMLYPVVESCLLPEIPKAWDRYRFNREVKEEDPVLTKGKILENLMSFLRHEVESEEHRVLVESSFASGIKRKESHKSVQRDKPTAATLIANTTSEKKNVVFSETVLIQVRTQKISIMNYEDRKLQMMRKRCWLVCLKLGHMAKKCHSGVKYFIRLSQGLFGGGISPATEHGRLKVTVHRKYSTLVALLDQPKIFSTLPRICNENLLAELASRGIKLTDIGKDMPPIRVLLGADVLFSILTGRIEMFTSGVSTVENLFGWTILGLGTKARVATVQRPTIPRLELLGVAIGARIASFILDTLNLPLKTYFWIDYMIGLGCITNAEPWNTFVRNRVKEIRELTNVEDWRFVSGHVNPAELLSRSCDWSEILRSQWWKGPKSLYERPVFWPRTKIILPEEAMLERRKNSVERVVKLHLANEEIIRPIQRIIPLEISSPDMPKNVPENVEDDSDIIDYADDVRTASNESTCQSEALPKEQLQTVKRTRFGRRMVPVKRLDL